MPFPGALSRDGHGPVDDIACASAPRQTYADLKSWRIEFVNALV